jgi:hypothetical protein
MPLDLSIYGLAGRGVKSVAEYDNEAAQAQHNKLENTLGQYTLSKAQRGDDDMNALMQHLQNGGDLSTPEGQAAAFRVAPLSAPAIIKSQLEQGKLTADTASSKATAAHLGSQTDAENFKTRVAKSDQAIKDISGFSTPQEALASLQAHEASGDIDPQKAAMIRSTIPQDTAQFPKWQLGMVKSIMAAKDQMALTVPDANAVLSANTSTSNNAATNATHVQTTGMTNATSRANNSANITKDYAVAGLNQDGTPGTSNDSMVDAIGQYKVQPPSGMALRNPRMQQILADVTAKYPDFDATQYGARQTAAKSFSTGKDGQSVQSANTALNHLATLKELAAAQDNGDIRLFNTLANRFSTETGGAAPTNLASAVTMVGPEISKAIIGAGGTGGDREKVDSALAALTKGGKAQAAGTIATMQDLFGGRLTETQRTYERTTGRKDFPGAFLSPAAQAVLAARNPAPAASSVPPDIAAILQKHGSK